MFLPALPVLKREPPDDPGFIFELKQDGFRAIAHIEAGQCRLISRRANVYKSFQSLCNTLAALGRNAVIDGEIVVLDDEGRAQFYDLLRRRGAPVLYAFDLLTLDGADLRNRPLIERKRILKRLVHGRPGVLYAQHFSEGPTLYRLICEQDLEGIVAKRRNGAYGEGWFKIRNPRYSLYEGRRELFRRGT